MADRFFQRVGSRTVLHGQVHVDFGDINIGHDTAHGELLGVGQGRGRSPSLRDRRIGQHGVVLLCGFTLGGQLGIVGVFDGRSIGCLHIGVISFAYQLTNQWIEKQPQRHNAASCRQ